LSTIQVEDITNAANGTGSAIDVASVLGNGSTVIPKAVVIAESSVTAGAVQLQSGVSGPGGIAWTAVGSPTALSAGAGVALTAPGAAVAFVRAVVTTPVTGGKCLVVITS
jgi:hypothetical protein